QSSQSVEPPQNPGRFSVEPPQNPGRFREIIGIYLTDLLALQSMRCGTWTVNATAALGLDFYCRQRTAELHPQLPVFGALLSAHGLLPKL
ncbi:hypothetical protein, partial [Xanthomonas citri]|uniref:hypothetical protein n=1 Tax=Xanthomonas citri TaxID=346 RepID=UPI001F383791